MLFLNKKKQNMPNVTVTRKKCKSYVTINRYRFVISSQSTQAYYLKCANFRRKCRARAIIRKGNMHLQLRHNKHNHHHNDSDNGDGDCSGTSVGSSYKINNL